MLKRLMLLICLFSVIETGNLWCQSEKQLLGYRSLPGTFFDPNNYVDLYIAYESLTAAYSASVGLANGFKLEKEAFDRLWQSEHSLRLKELAQAKRDQFLTIFISSGIGFIAGIIVGSVLTLLIKK